MISDMTPSSLIATYHEIQGSINSGAIFSLPKEKLQQFTSALTRPHANANFGKSEFPGICETVRMVLSTRNQEDMARKAPSAQPLAANLTTEAMRVAIPKLRRRIEDLEAFDPKSVRSRSDPRIEALDKKLDHMIEDVFGANTTEYSRFRPAGLDSAGYVMGYNSPISDVIDGLQHGKERELANLTAIIDIFEEKIADGGPATPTHPIMQSNDFSKVFIVHGRDSLAKTETARFVEKFGFTAIILHEQASAGNTIIEKIEEHTNVGFAIVLYTPCDVGSLSGEGAQKPRARQNVVFEHGYLVAKLGRKNVCALVKGDTEIPNDLSGVVYVAMDSAGAWHLTVAKELRAAGYAIDMNKVI